MFGHQFLQMIVVNFGFALGLQHSFYVAYILTLLGEKEYCKLLRKNSSFCLDRVLFVILG